MSTRTPAPPPAAIAKASDRPVSEQVQTMIRSMAPRFESALSKRIGIERLATTVCLAVAGNRKLEECSAASIVQSALRAAQLNLSPDPNLGEAYIVPYRTKEYGMVASLQLGYKGMIKLAIRGGLRKIYGQVIREGEAWSVSLGIMPDLKHTPSYSGGQPTHAYAVAWLASGEVDFEVLPWDEVMAIKARSKSGDNGPWVTDPEEMAKKTAMRRLMKRLNLDYELPEIAALVASDDEGGMRQVFAVAPQELDPPAIEPEPDPASDEQPPDEPPAAAPAKRQAPLPPPTVLGSAIIGPLVEGCPLEVVLGYLRSINACPMSATSLDQVFQRSLPAIQADPAAFRAALDAYLAK
jgi:recombination protein RecT